MHLIGPSDVPFVVSVGSDLNLRPVVGELGSEIQTQKILINFY